WTASLEGPRLTLRAAGSSKTRMLVRIDPDRLRRLHAGMRASNWAPEENWRCFFGNATAGDGAFSPLRANRSYRAPEFLDRYLRFASYVTALRSAADHGGPAAPEQRAELYRSARARDRRLQCCGGGRRGSQGARRGRGEGRR